MGWRDVPAPGCDPSDGAADMSRVKSATRSARRRAVLVISDEVARPLLDTCSDLVSLGQYRLRGVARRVELFTLD